MKSKVFFVAICTVFFTTSISFAYETTFIPRITLSGEYTDNLFLTDENKEDDFITRVTPGFTAQLLGRHSGAELSYDFGYVKHNTYDERDYWEHLAELSGWTNFGRNTRLDIADSFLYTQDPVIQDDIARIRNETPGIPIDSTIRNSLNVYYTNFASINLNHQFGANDSFRLGYINRHTKNDDPTLEDSRGNTPSIGVIYWFLPQWGFEANASYVMGDFEFSDDRDGLLTDVRLIKQYTPNFQGYIRYRHVDVNYDEITEDDQTYNPSIGFDYSITNETSLVLDVGWFKNEFEFREDQSGLTLEMLLTKNFRRGLVHLTALSGYDYALFGAQNLNFEKYYEGAGSVTYQLLRYLSGNIFASYRHSKYSDVIPERTDKTTRAGLGLTYQAFQWMSFGLDYTYRLVDSTDDLNEYDVNRVLFSVTLTPSRPF